jgi:alkanesulfonate monooxygenase SsuD/methylene tetrahydromethanopterin reductase-like flavin-dependent oxidoreductase (luciferase family)
VFGSGNSEESVVFAAQRRLGLAISFAPVGQVARMVARYRAEAEKAGWSPGPDQVLYRTVAQVGETDGAASPAGGEGILRPGVFGGPRQVLGQLESLRDAGVGVVDVAFAGIGHQRAMAALDVLAESVLPTMRQM